MTAQPQQLELVPQRMTDTEDNMGDPLPIRAWARESGWPTLGSRGPIGFDIRQAYASFYGLEEPTRTERATRTNAAGEEVPRPRTWAQCSGCGREWKGHDECHCTRCHQHFSQVKNFDAHLAYVRGSNEEETRCVDALTLKTGNGLPRFTTKDSYGGKTVIQLVTRKMPQAEQRQEQLELAP